MRRQAIVLALTLAAVASLQSRADDVTHFGDGVGPDIPNILDSIGIGANNQSSESTSYFFTVPGQPGTTTNLLFNYLAKDSTFISTFGYFPVDAVSDVDPADRAAWLTAALSAATVIFDDRLVEPGAALETPIPAGTKIGFFLIPDASLPEFLANIDGFLSDPTGQGGGDDALRSPLTTFSCTNPSARDQSLAFAINDLTLVTFEDLTRAGDSDDSFTDVAYTINTELGTDPIDCDADGFEDSIDNCSLPNPLQLDLDGNGLGDACDFGAANPGPTFGGLDIPDSTVIEDDGTQSDTSTNTAPFEANFFSAGIRATGKLDAGSSLDVGLILHGIHSLAYDPNNGNVLPDQDRLPYAYVVADVEIDGLFMGPPGGSVSASISGSFDFILGSANPDCSPSGGDTDVQVHAPAGPAQLVDAFGNPIQDSLIPFDDDYGIAIDTGAVISQDTPEIPMSSRQVFIFSECGHCFGDWNLDHNVDVVDLLSFLSRWFNLDADIDRSGLTDVVDLLMFLGFWFEPCPL